MIELTIRVGDEDMKEEMKVPMYVSNPPPVSTDKYYPIVGWWTCYSKLLGKGTAGEYYLMNYKLQSCQDTDLYWIECDRRPLANPVAFFRDHGQHGAFLVLFEFVPQEFTRSLGHGDKLHLDKNGYLKRREYCSWGTAKSY